MSNVDPSFPAATTAVTIATDNTLNLNTKKSVVQHEIDAKLSEPLKINPNLTQPDFAPHTLISKEDRRGSLKDTGDFSSLSPEEKESERKKLAERLLRRPSKFDLKLRNIIRVDSTESLIDKTSDVPKTFEEKTRKLKSCLKRRPAPIELVEKNILKDVPDVANSLKAATASLQKAQLVDNLNHLLAQRPSPEEVPSRIIQFEDYVQVAETFMKQEYNRQPDTNATFRKLTPKMKMEIRAELNDFKKNEMEVHTESLKNTSFH